MFNGAFRERLRNSWVEMRENLTRSTLQSLGVILGVASVLGGFSISDSMRRRSDGALREDGRPRQAERPPVGRRQRGRADARSRPRTSACARTTPSEGEEIDSSRGRRHLAPQGRAGARALAVRRPGARHPRHRRRLPGSRRLRDRAGPRLHVARHRLRRARRDPRHRGGRDLLPQRRRARPDAAHRRHAGPGGRRPQGARLPVPRRPAQHLPLAQPHHRLPTTLVARAVRGRPVPPRRPRHLPHPRRSTRWPTFSKALSGVLKANHRQQEDFRLDDVGARVAQAAVAGRRLRHHLPALRVSCR